MQSAVRKRIVHLTLLACCSVSNAGVVSQEDFAIPAPTSVAATEVNVWATYYHVRIVAESRRRNRGREHKRARHNQRDETNPHQRRRADESQSVHFKPQRIDRCFLFPAPTDYLRSFPTVRFYRTRLRPVFSRLWPIAGESGCSTASATPSFGDD